MWLCDSDQHLFIEKHVCGDVAQVYNRYARANNPYVSVYVTKEEHNYLLYLDCRRLYKKAMTQQLFIADICWLYRNVIDALDVYTLRDDDEIGYIL